MISVHIVIEDTVIVAERKQVEDCPMWVGTCVNLHYGKSHDFRLHEDQFAAILSLGVHGVGEESLPGYDVAQLYKLAEGPSKIGRPSVVRFPNMDFAKWRSP